MAKNPNGIQVGDVVQLKSGGPLLTVFDLEYEETAKCYYATPEPAIKTISIETVALQKAPPDAKRKSGGGSSLVA